MPSEMINIECPTCGSGFDVSIDEFADVSVDPEVKTRIIEGEFFIKTCPECGDTVLVEYPLMYTDPDRKLNVYLAPEHDDDLLEQMNSLDIPPVETDPGAIYRVVSDGTSLMEKILLAERGRDDRVIELYKFVIWDQVQAEWPDLEPGDLLYVFDEEGEYLVIWNSDNGNDEKLTVELDEELYDDLAKNYLALMAIPANDYAEVDQAWIGERFDRED